MTNNSDYGSIDEAGAQVVVVDGEKKRSNEEYSVTWSDSFYDDHESNIIAVFDVDYMKLRKMIRFSQFYSIIKVTIVAGLVCLPALLNGSETFREGLPGYAVVFFVAAGWLIFVLRQQERERNGVFETHVAVTSSGVRKDYSKFLYGSILRSSDEMLFGDIKSISTQRGCVETCCSCSSAHSVVVESIEGDVAHLLPAILEADTLVDIVMKKISNLPVEDKVEVPEEPEKEVV